jgi:AhpD family alkylhydroperoxidase
MKNKLISKAFKERIFLAVTEVNGCRYCSYYHTQQALKAGISEDEIEELLSGTLGDVPSEQVPALLFAQHYAESVGHPEIEAWQRIVESYGAEAAQEILSTIRVIMVGNLYGNMMDALRSRLSGEPFPESKLRQELGIVFGILLFIPVIAVKRWISKRFGLEKEPKVELGFRDEVQSG